MSCNIGSGSSRGYSCMKKGIGIGTYKIPKSKRAVRMPSKYKKTYCGEGSIPSGHRKGSNYECFKKGIDIGRKIQWYGFGALQTAFTTDNLIITIFVSIVATLVFKIGMSWSMWWSVILGIVVGVLFVGLYYYLTTQNKPPQRTYSEYEIPPAHLQQPSEELKNILDYDNYNVGHNSSLDDFGRIIFNES